MCLYCFTLSVSIRKSVLEVEFGQDCPQCQPFCLLSEPFFFYMSEKNLFFVIISLIYLSPIIHVKYYLGTFFIYFIYVMFGAMSFPNHFFYMYLSQPYVNRPMIHVKYQVHFLFIYFIYVRCHVCVSVCVFSLCLLSREFSKLFNPLSRILVLCPQPQDHTLPVYNAYVSQISIQNTNS